MKQIHRFFLAARAESTAFSVCLYLPQRSAQSQTMTKIHLRSLGVLLDVVCLSLDCVDDFILLFNQDAHLRSNQEGNSHRQDKTYVIKQLSKLSERLFDTLDVFMSLLHFTIGTLGVGELGVHELANPSVRKLPCLGTSLTA